MKIRFQNPPINELVLADYLSPPVFTLRSEHIGLLPMDKMDILDI